jgi:hypothetical protein
MDYAFAENEVSDMIIFSDLFGQQFKYRMINLFLPYILKDGTLTTLRLDSGYAAALGFVSCKRS